MARVGIEVIVDGPLFDGDPVKKTREAIDLGAVDLTGEISSLAVDLAPFRSGEYRNSFRVYNSKTDDMFAWAHANPYGRGTLGARSTWLETGKRRGVKTARRGSYHSRTATRRFSGINKDEWFLPYLMEAFNGS